MSFDLLERSRTRGSPIELIRIVHGSERWLFTSGDRAVTYNSETYVKVPIKRDNLKQSSDINKASLNFTVARDNPVVVRFLNTPGIKVIDVTVFRAHRGDLTDFVVAWKGRLLQVGIASASTGTLKCESIHTSMRRIGLRAVYQGPCRHALYETGCNVNADLYKVTGTVSAVVGSTLTMPEFATKPDGRFVGGYIKRGDDDFQIITAHAGASVTLLYPVVGLAAGDAISAFPGCAHTEADCDSYYDNLDNFGGFSRIPTVNPFSGDPIY